MRSTLTSHLHLALAGMIALTAWLVWDSRGSPNLSGGAAEAGSETEELSPGNPEWPFQPSRGQEVRSLDEDAETETWAFEERLGVLSASADFAGQLRELTEDPSPEAAELRRVLIRQWAEKDPQAVADGLSELEPSPIQRAAQRDLAVTWAKSQLSMSLEWAQGLPEGDQRTAALLDVGYEAARTAPLAAVTLGSQMTASAERDQFLAFATSQWAATDASEALAWARQVPDDQLRQRLLAEVVVAAADSNPQGAAVWAVESMNPGPAQDRAVVAVVQRWAQQAPSQAAEWVAQFPDGQAGRSAIRSLVEIWSVEDPAAAGEWLKGLPPGAGRDSGLKLLSQFGASGGR